MCTVVEVIQNRTHKHPHKLRNSSYVLLTILRSGIVKYKLVEIRTMGDESLERLGRLI